LRGRHIFKQVLPARRSHLNAPRTGAFICSCGPSSNGVAVGGRSCRRRLLGAVSAFSARSCVVEI
jgi:hypothetical protein